MNAANARYQPERKQVLILANPKAGSRGGRATIDALVAGLQERDLTARICDSPQELDDQLHARADLVRCVVAAGGDGTLLEVVNRAGAVPVALLPLGNENLMARYFHIERSADSVADIIDAGASRQLDLMRVGNRLVSLVASAGFDAEVVHRVHRQRYGHIGRLNYLMAICAVVRRYQFPEVSVTIADSGENLEGCLVFVFNVPEYGLGLPIAPRAAPDDGLLDLYVFRTRGVTGLVQSVAAVLRGRHHNDPNVEYRQVRRVRLSSDLPVHVQTDGDDAGMLPADIEIVPAAFRILVKNSRI
jgi:diacylglycerol kinase (ATP)